MIFNKLLNFSEYQYSHLYLGDKKDYIIGFYDDTPR